MKKRHAADNAWEKLSRLGGSAPPDGAEMPFGLATRVVAAWKSSPAEGFFAALEGLTWRGVAVAAGILCACAAFGYDALSSAFNGDASQAGEFLSEWFGQ